MDDVLKRLEKYIRANNLVSKGDKILLSLSAGKDSIFMLDQLNQLKEIIGFEIGAFHLNHLMRGEDSDLDEKFISDAAENKKIRFFSERFDFKKDKAKASFEERAREVRYNLLNGIAEKYGYNKIATAHTQSDNIETVLMRIFTGTGVFGLKGITALNGNIIRPLIFLKSDEIINYLNLKKISWREDLSNSDMNYLRNYFRKEIFPLVEKKIPHAGESISRLSKISIEHYSLLENHFFNKIKKEYPDNEDTLLFETAGFSSAELKASIDYFSRMNFNQYLNESILEECAKKYLSDKHNIDLYLNKNFTIKKINKDGLLKVKISNKPEKNILDWNYSLNINDIQNGIDIHVKEAGLLLHFYLTDYPDFSRNYINCRYIFVTVPDNQLQIILRSRKQGDNIDLEFGRKKIKDLLIEKKLDNKTKNYVPLLVIGEEIAAVMTGFLDNNTIQNRVSEKFSVKPDSGQILAISLRTV